jgi:hypothetical protein
MPVAYNTQQYYNYSTVGCGTSKTYSPEDGGSRLLRNLRARNVRSSGTLRRVVWCYSRKNVKCHMASQSGRHFLCWRIKNIVVISALNTKALCYSETLAITRVISSKITTPAVS